MIKMGPYIERSQARGLGATYYMTGRPCKNGHVDRKLTSSNKCESCKVRTDERRAYEAAWKRKKRENPAFVAIEMERRNAWLNKDGVREGLYARNRARNRKRYKEDSEYRERVLEKSRISHINNPERLKESGARWRANNPDKVRMKNHKRREHREITQGRNKDVNISFLFKRNLGFCPYCSSELFSGYHLDHIIPVSLGGGNDMDNLQCICARCNLRKGAKHPDEWHEEIGWHTAAIRG